MEMEKRMIMKMMRLPVGYRFWPTDEELLEHYLKRKVFDLPLPPLIPVFDVFLTHPSNLPGDMKEKRYFFTKHKKGISSNSSSKRRRRRTKVGCGIWKSIGKEKLIVGMNNQVLVGVKNCMVYYESKSSSPTKWVMHEYTLPPSVSASATTPNSTQLEVEDWAVYCLFQKRRRPKKQGGVAEIPQPCSSCSSGLTQISDQEEEENSSDLANNNSF